jgi:hypothetical protein
MDRCAKKARRLRIPPTAADGAASAGRRRKLPLVAGRPLSSMAPAGWPGRDLLDRSSELHEGVAVARPGCFSRRLPGVGDGLTRIDGDEVHHLDCARGRLAVSEADDDGRHALHPVRWPIPALKRAQAGRPLQLLVQPFQVRVFELLQVLLIHVGPPPSCWFSRRRGSRNHHYVPEKRLPEGESCSSHSGTVCKNRLVPAALGGRPWKAT